MKWNSNVCYDLTIYSDDEHVPFAMACINQTVYIDQMPVSTIVKEDSLYWDQPAYQRCGRIVSLNHSRLLGGVLLDQTGVHVFKASCDSKYIMTFTDDQQQQEYELCLGSRMENGSLIETMELHLLHSNVNLAYSHLCEGKGNSLHIQGTMFDGLEGYQNFSFYDVTLADDLMSMYGSAWHSEEASFIESASMRVSGSYVMSERERQIRRQIHSAGEAMPTVFDDQRITYLNEKTPLYVESLFMVPMPNVEAVNTNFSSYLHNLMLYYIDDDQITYIGNPDRPHIGSDITQEMVDFVDANPDVKTLLVGHYYEACLSSILAAGDYEYSYLIKDIEFHKERLDGYYNGHEATSFCNEPAYQKLTDRLYGMVYFQSIPEIKPYLSEAKKWAFQVHDYALYEELARLMLDEYTHDIQSRLQHLVILLNYLYPDKCIQMVNPQNSPLCMSDHDEPTVYLTSLGSDLYYHLLNRCVMNKTMTDTMTDIVMNEDQRHQYYGLAAKQLIKRIYGEQTLTPELQDLKNAIDEALKNKIITVPEDYYPYIAAALLEFEIWVSGEMDRTIFQCLDDFYKTHPKIRIGIRVAALMLTQGLMIWNSISTFVNWDEMSSSQQASAVLSFSYSIVDIFNNGYEAYGNWCKNSTSIEAMSEFSSSSSGSVKGTQALKSQELDVMTNEGKGFWERVMKSSEEMPKMMKFCGGLMSAFAFSVCVCDIVSDVAKYGYAGWLTAFNVINGIVNGIAMVATIGFAFISTFLPTIIGSFAFVSLLPGIGWICTIAGILISFITYFIRRYGTKSLEQKYLEENCVPFVKQLVIPKNNQTIIWEFQEKNEGLAMNLVMAE